MDQSDWRKHSFDSVADSTKQLMTVATGVVTATVLFSSDLDPMARYWAYASWLLFFASVFFGIAVLFNISGSLIAASQSSAPSPSIDKGTRALSVCQLVAFLIGIPALVGFGYQAVNTKKVASPPTPVTVTCVVPLQPASSPVVAPAPP